MAGQICVLCLVCIVAKSWAQLSSCPMGFCLVQGQCYLVIGLGSQCSPTQQCICNSATPAGMTAGPGTACDAADSRCPGSGACLFNGQCYKAIQNGGTCAQSETCMCLGARSTTVSQFTSPNPMMGAFACDPTDPQCPGGATDCRLDGQCYTLLGTGSICSSSQQCLCNSVGPVGPATSCDATDPACPGTSRCLYNGQCYNALEFGAMCATTEQCVCVGDQGAGGAPLVSCDNNESQCPGPLSCQLSGQCFNAIADGTICSSSQQCICSGVGQAGPARSCDVADSRCPGSGSCLYNGQCYKVIQLGSRCMMSEQCVCLASAGMLLPTATQSTSPNPMTGPFVCDPLDPQCPGGATDCRLYGQCYIILGTGSICSSSQQCLCTSVGPVGPATSCDATDPACPGTSRCRYNGQCYNVLQFGGTCASTEQCVCIGDQGLGGTPIDSCDNTNPQCQGTLNCLLYGQCYNVLAHGSICSSTQQCFCSSLGQAGPAASCDIMDSRCPGTGSCLYNDQCYKVITFGGFCQSSEQCVCLQSSGPTVSRRVLVGHMMRSLWQNFKCSMLGMDC